MMFKLHLCYFVLNLFGISALDYFPSDCTKANIKVNEGIFKESKSGFPWMGILRVRYREIKEDVEAVSNFVLIKDTFGIAHANDVVGIPRKVLLEDSKVMFILENDVQWFSKVKDYVVHPEYKVSTLNTIVVLELHKFWSDEIASEDTFLAQPICWPNKKHNTQTDLYVIGYTDENEILQKSIYKLKLIEKPDCDNTYKLYNLTEIRKPPVDYQCAVGENFVKACVWENGMVVASNSTGVWEIIGLTTRGPGCAAPTRFINLKSYLSWIKNLITWDIHSKTENGTRKTAFGQGFKIEKPQKIAESVENIPVHKLFNEIPVLRGNQIDGDIVWSPYYHDNYTEFETSSFTGKPTSKWQLISTHLDKENLKADFELLPSDCQNHSNKLVYSEKTIVGQTPSKLNEGKYMITVNDERLARFTCIKLKMKSLVFGPAKSWVDFDVEVYPNKVEQPRHLLKIPTKAVFTSFETLNDTSDENGVNSTKIPNHKLPVLEEAPRRILTKTINLVVKFKMVGRAELFVQVYGLMKPVIKNVTKSKINHRRHQNNIKNKPKDLSDVKKEFSKDENLIQTRESLDAAEMKKKIKEIARRRKKMKSRIGMKNRRLAKHVKEDKNDNSDVLVWRSAEYIIDKACSLNETTSIKLVTLLLMSCYLF